MKGLSLSPTYPSVLSLKPAIDLGPHQDATLDVFFAFLIIGGHVGLPLALATMVILKTVAHRHPTLLNLLASWIVYATANLLLLYSGEARKESPEFGVCLTQASMIYGSTVGVAAATLGLVLQLWLEFRGMSLKKDSKASTLTVRMSVTCSETGDLLICCLMAAPPALKNVQLMLLPWASFALITIGSAIFGVRHPDLVSIQWQFYCTLTSNAVIYTVCAFTLVLLALILGFQAAVLRILFKASRQFRARNQNSYHLVLRVGIFTIYSVITFIVSIVITLKPTATFAYLFVSTLPLAAFFIFGTQKENLRFWFRIRKSGKHIQLKTMPSKPVTVQLAGKSGLGLNSNSDKPVPKVLPAEIDEEHGGAELDLV